MCLNCLKKAVHKRLRIGGTDFSDGPVMFQAV